MENSSSSHIQIKDKTMSKENNGGPSFHFVETMCCAVFTGMMIRDYFAAKALSAYSINLSDEYEPVEYASAIARDCYIMADAMLKEREK